MATFIRYVVDKKTGKKFIFLEQRGRKYLVIDDLGNQQGFDQKLFDSQIAEAYIDMRAKFDKNFTRIQREAFMYFYSPALMTA